MGAVIKNPWGDGRDAAVLDNKCCARPCLRIGENKGVYTRGKGYRYHEKPWLECWTRHEEGCPDPLPEPDSEAVRCCPVPDFPKPRKGQVNPKQKCRSCGEAASGWLLEVRRDLPHQPHSVCAHRNVRAVSDPSLWYCPGCGCYWEHKPLPHALGETYTQIILRLPLR